MFFSDGRIVYTSEPIIHYQIPGNSEQDTGVLLNLAMTSNITYTRKKALIVMVYTLNGLGDTTSAKLCLITIGRDGNTIHATLIKDVIKSGSSGIINSVTFEAVTRTDSSQNTLKIVNASNGYVCVDIYN